MKALTLAFQDDPRFAELKKHRDESGGIHHVWGMDRRITPLLMEALSDTKRFRLIVTYEARAGDRRGLSVLQPSDLLLSSEGRSLLFRRYSQ